MIKFFTLFALVSHTFLKETILLILFFGSFLVFRNNSCILLLVRKYSFSKIFIDENIFAIISTPSHSFLYHTCPAHSNLSHIIHTRCMKFCQTDFYQKIVHYIFFLMEDGLLKVQWMGTSPFHSPRVSTHKKLSAVV